MNGLRAHLLCCVWRASWRLQSPWQGALLPWCGHWKQSLQKRPILVLWMQFGFLMFELNRSPIYRIEIGYTQIVAQYQRLVAFYCDWHAFSLKLRAFIHMAYYDDKKKQNTVLNMSWKTSLRRYTNRIAFLLLGLTELILRAFNISTS